MLRAFARVRSTQPARLVIVGDGKPEARAELMRLAAELGCATDVSLPGFTYNPFCYMAHAAVFVLSSLHEGLPGVLIQALACGAPVVSTDCPSGPREILEGGRHGRLVDLGDDRGHGRGQSRPHSANRAIGRHGWRVAGSSASIGRSTAIWACSGPPARPHLDPRAAGRSASTGTAMTESPPVGGMAAPTLPRPPLRSTRRSMQPTREALIAWPLTSRCRPASAGACRVVPVVRSFPGERSANGRRTDGATLIGRW